MTVVDAPPKRRRSADDDADPRIARRRAAVAVDRQRRSVQDIALGSRVLYDRPTQ